MRIGDAAAQAGVTAKTMRFYEKVGLVPPAPRTQSGYREYGTDLVARVNFIKSAQAMGFSLGEIGEILSWRDRGADICEPVVALVRQRVQDLNERIEAMERTRSELRRLLRVARTCPPGPGGRCHVIERIVPRPS